MKFIKISSILFYFIIGISLANNNLSNLLKLSDSTNLNSDTKKELIKKINAVFGSPYNYTNSLEKQGLYPELDTLYQLLNKIIKLSSFDKMRWANIKFTLGKSNEGAKVYALATENRTRYIIQNNFKKDLKNYTNKADAENALNRYILLLKKRGKLTEEDLRWAIKTASDLEYYTLELDLIKLYIPDTVNQSSFYLAAAQKLYFKGEMPEALTAAYKCLGLSASKTDMVKSAGIIYRSYLIEKKLDSAIVWLEKTELNRTSQITDAIVLCQLTGNTSSENRLLSMLPLGFSKDTLLIRQMLFSNNFIAAEKKLAEIKASNYIKNSPIINRYGRILLWELRVSFFKGNYRNIIITLKKLDIKKLDSHLPESNELLQYRVISEKMRNYPDAISLYGKISLFNYCNNQGPPPDIIKYNLLPTNIYESLISKLVKGYFKNGKFTEADSIINLCPDTIITPELKYYKIITFDKLGKIDLSQKLFNEILLDNKGSMYSQKARMYFLNKSKNMVIP